MIIGRHLIFAALLLSPIMGQQNLETDLRLSGIKTLAAFEAQRQVVQQSSAVINIGMEEIAYGVVISEHGHVLTKASELRDAEKIAVTITTMSSSNHISSAPACDDSSRFRWLLRTLICRI